MWEVRYVFSEDNREDPANPCCRRTDGNSVERDLPREWYTDYLKNNPYAPDMFKRFIEHIISQMRNEDLIEESVLKLGYF